VSDQFGPFSVDPGQVVGLGGAVFQELINRLLTDEVTAGGFSQVNLRTSYQANVGDRGVDALIESAEETSWVPAGDSAWQFKAGDLGPEGCAAELAGATFAHEILRRGGKYRLVLGKGMEAHLIDERERRLREKASELGFDVSNDNFKVIDGNQLARWIEQYPGLAMSSVIRASGSYAVGFDRWVRKQSNRIIWVPSRERDEVRTQILDLLNSSGPMDLRIEGPSGIGKTRAVLEALRGAQHESLVLYVGDANDLDSSVIDHLIIKKRSVVLVVDECTRKRHKVFAENLEVGAGVRLVTIGTQDASMSPFNVLKISPLTDDVIDDVLTKNHPTLWPEARRVVVENCSGNVGWALYLAQAVLNSPRASVRDLIDAAGLREFILGMVASDGDFLAVSALALFARFGFDGEKRSELEAIARGLDIPMTELLAAVRRLEEKGLVAKHGRYRAVTPQPLAVLLAAQAWEQLEDKILGSLLPALDGAMAERLFLRAADLGSTGAAATALSKILGTDGPFASLAAIAENSYAHLLIQLAIVSPDEVTAHLQALIDGATDQELKDMTSIRRSLVWALEKLVWHTSTFEAAAALLLRLALSENETFSNNATGTWINLFGALLPATAALPDQRLSYLARTIEHQSADVRRIAVAAAEKALDTHGTVMVSGELQRGAVVEPRGMPATWPEVWRYQVAAIELLRTRAIEDSEAEIREAAVKALVDVIHPVLANEYVREDLFDALASLPMDALKRVWTEVNHLEALFDRVETPEFARATNSTPDVLNRRAGLRILRERLPAPDQAQELAVLAAAHRWEWDGDELLDKVLAVARSMPQAEAERSILQLLEGSPPAEASYELGFVLHAVAPSAENEHRLVELANAGNLGALTGYLYARASEVGDRSFDDLLDGDFGQQLDPDIRIAITVRGPQTESGWLRVLNTLKLLPVSVGAARLFGWHIDADERRLVTMLADWLPRIETQVDYNTVTDVVALMVYKQPSLSPNVESQISELVRLREQFKDVGQQSHDWARLARRRLSTDPTGLLVTLLQLLDAEALDVYAGNEEQTLLQDAIAAAGHDTLDQVFEVVDRGSWRLQLDFRGWLAEAYSATDLTNWIGQDLGRARLVASVAHIGDGQPSGVVQFLLANFDSDDQVASSLYSALVSGTWWGNESVRINGQIEQLNGWVNDPSQPQGVKRWARSVIASLKHRLDDVLLREAEAER
jgi:hypothetical protein